MLAARGAALARRGCAGRLEILAPGLFWGLVVALCWLLLDPRLKREREAPVPVAVSVSLSVVVSGVVWVVRSWSSCFCLEVSLGFARRAAEEWLDEDAGDAGEVESALRSLAFVNRWFGGRRVHRLLLEEVAERARLPELRVLEVAAGRATALAGAARALGSARKGRDGVTVRAVLLDRQASHLPDRWPAGLPAPERLVGDALALPLEDKSVDVVSCCLFVHHLGPEEVRRFVAEARRVARVAVVVNDLERTRGHYALARLFALVDPSRLSRHDGPVSVRQAYTAGELRTLLGGVVRRRYLCRLAGCFGCEGVGALGVYARSRSMPPSSRWRREPMFFAGVIAGELPGDRQARRVGGRWSS